MKTTSKKALAIGTKVRFASKHIKRNPAWFADVTGIVVGHTDSGDLLVQWSNQERVCRQWTSDVARLS
jgi:hypothetical protein